MDMHNTRLFPKFTGASSYRLSGIAARCDWAVMTDSGSTEIFIHGDLSRQPRTVFLSLRSCFDAIPTFIESVLPKIANRFVLITGSEDITIPSQKDARWRSFTAKETEQIYQLINDDRLIHWFAENRDQDLPKVSTMPVGYVFHDSSSASALVDFPELKLKNRPLKMLCAHRIREGEQWQTRSRVTNLCRERLGHLSTIVEEELPLEIFKQQIRQHPFVICAHGGGLDPSPKAWTCIANGSIPIIKSSALDDAYSQLPVAFVEDWEAKYLSEARLRDWIGDLGPYFELDQLREQTVYRLSLDYWWAKVENKYCARSDQ